MSIARLKDLCVPKGLTGGPFGSSLVGADYVDLGIPVIRGGNLGPSRFVGGQYVFVSQEKFDRDLSRNQAIAGDLIFTQRGTLGQVGIVPDSPYPAYVISQSQMRLRVDETKALRDYVYYACAAPEFLAQVSSAAIATGVPHINLSILARLTILLPSIPVQKSIAEVLGALDDKIAANTQLVELLDEYLVAQYLGVTAKSCRSTSLKEVSVFKNNRRIPLSSNQRELRAGSVPYYGAAGIVGRVDSPIFDEPLVLVGEDGTVVTDQGAPVVQYIWGPSWVNNHAHVLVGNGISTELLRLALQQAEASSLVTGAVQPKLSMGNAQRIQLTIPTGSALYAMEGICSQGMAMYRATKTESRSLAELRDTLLPELMSGRLRVEEAEKQVEAVV